MNFKRWINALLCMLVCMSLMLGSALAAEETPPPTLQVNGVDALATSSGDGWSYNSSTKTLTLNGYNGGSIVAGYMDLKVVLAAGSTNVVSTTDKYGIACAQTPFSTPYYKLSVEGGEGSTLDITAKNYALYSKGNLSIENCQLTAKNTTSNTADEMECIHSESEINITNCIVDVTSPAGIGIACYEEHTIRKSTVKVNAGMIGIQANNVDLEISDSKLDVTGKIAALYSSCGTVHLTRCTGQLKAETAAIYGEDRDGNSHAEIIDCDLALTAPYGVLTYTSALIENGNLTFDCKTMAIYAYSSSYTAQVRVKGNATINASPATPQLMRVYGQYVADSQPNVTGVILEYTEDADTTRILLVGEMTIAADTAYKRNVCISAGSNVTVAEGISFDLSEAPSVVIEGTLTNQGTLKLAGANTTNNGVIYNHDKINLTDSKPIVNKKTIYSACTSDFDLKPYAENGIVFHTELVKVDEKPATSTAAGNIAYWHCEHCDKYFSDQEGTKEITLDETVIPVVPTASAEIPQTGDNSRLTLWMSLLLLFGACLFTLARKQRSARRK